MTFEKRPDESAKAFAAFKCYCDLGAERSITGVAMKQRRSRSMVKRWCLKFSWVERAKAFDAHLEGVARQAEDERLRIKAVDWARRMESLREDEWQAGRALRKKAVETMNRLDARPTFGEAVRALELASKLERLACGLPSDKTEVAGPENGPVAIATTPVVIYLPDNGRDKPNGQ